MLDLTAINGLVKELLPELNGKVIQQNQGADSPEKPYCAWRIISEVEVGLAAIGEKASLTPTTSITQVAERTKIASVEFQFYTETKQRGAEFEAREVCNKFLTLLYLQDAKDWAYNNDYSILEVQDYSNLDLHLSDVWERRAACELQVMYIDQAEQDIPFIEYDPDRDSGITGTYINTDGTEL